MKAQWWSQQSQATQASAERGDARAFYGDVKRLGRWFSTRGLIRRPLCADRAAACHRFAEHVEHVLNVVRPVVDSTWQGLPVHDCSALVPALWDPPDIVEVTACLRKLARNKSPDAFGIHAELLRALVADDPAELGPLRHLHCLVCDYWADRPVSHERWLTAILVPIFKGKDDFDDLGNHRGIVLVDVLSKLVSRVLNERRLGRQTMCEATYCGRTYKFTQDIFPMRCPICEENGVNSLCHKSVHHFKLHVLRDHVY